MASQSAPLHPGDLAITCGHCDLRPVTTAQRFSILRGMLFTAQTGTLTVVGCRTCVRRAGRRTLTKNLLLGWWSLPWGLLTPVVVVQNLFRIAAPTPGCLAAAFRERGIDIERWRVDAYGLTPMEWDLLRVAAAARVRFAYAGGVALSPATASALLVDLSGDRISHEQADALLAGAQGTPPDPRMTPEAFRDGILWALAGFVPRENPQDFLAPLRSVATWLGCDRETIAEVFTSLADHLAWMPATDLELERAFSVLELATTAGQAEVQRSYKRLLLRWHPDRAVTNDLDVTAATEQTQVIVAAYRTITKARGWSSGSN